MRLDIFLHIHNERCEQLDKLLASVESLRVLIMATSAEFQAGFDRLNVATTKIADLLRGIGSNIGSMSAEEEDAAKAQLEAAAASLEAMATSVTDPVPVPVPPEEPLP